jgi:DNA (cytosine-5)-methyltransferase 1
MPPVPDAFVTTYYRNGQTVDPFEQPMPTATTHDRYGLVTLEERTIRAKGESVKVDIMECGFRMLEPHEVKRAMAFPDDYKLLGSRREQVKLAGNAVTYPVMEFLVQACVDAMS